MATQSSSAQVLQSQLVITETFNRFKATVTKEDQKDFDRTAVNDVVDAMVSIQASLRQRRENRNLRKLYPFVQGLQKYSGAIEVLSNGLSPYLPWIWAPIKLMLQVTSDYLGAFDKLIEAYGKIAETLPRFSAYNEAFRNNPAFLAKLALYYADLLEFHRRAYKMVRRTSWKFFFMTTWACFDVRFDSIVASLARYSDMIDREAAAIDIVEAKQCRESQEAKVIQQEEERKNRQRLSVVSWLGLPAQSQHDECERLLRDCLPGSCDWVLKHAKIDAWLGNDTKCSVVWLHGKPGAGKSVISASLLNLLDDHGTPAIFYFCKYQQADNSSNILKTLVLQLITRNSDLAAIAYADYVMHNPSPSLKVLRAMLAGSKEKPSLLQGASPCRIVIDGLDECQESEQRFVVEDLLQLVSVRSSSYNCKLLICSRNIPEISRALQKKAKLCTEISLSHENRGINSAIQAFIQTRLRNMEEDHSSLHIGTDVLETLSQVMIDKANGMFLWVKLVLESLHDVDSMEELHEAITMIPRELPQVYDTILERLLSRRGEKGSHKIIRILAWLAFARRPLKRHEILHGVAITPETPSLETWNVLHNAAIDKCKPFVEELPDKTVALVHFTAQEYLITQGFVERVAPVVWENLITFACTTTLQHGLSLLDPNTQAKNQLVQVLNGFHALLPYSIDFWIDHLLGCAAKNRIEPDSPTAHALAKFDALHQRMQLAQKLRPTAAQMASVEEPDSRVGPIAHLPIAPLCSAILAFRAQSKVQSASNGEESEKKALENDPTLLTALAAKFETLVNQLLSGSALAEFSKEQLELFKQQYSQASFRCRYPACSSTSRVFRSEADRASHEEQHVRRLFCEKPNCARGRMGLRTQQDLRAHNKAYHEEGSILVPAKVRRSAPEPQEATEDGATEETGTTWEQKSDAVIDRESNRYWLVVCSFNGSGQNTHRIRAGTIRKITRRLGGLNLDEEVETALQKHSWPLENEDWVAVYNSDNAFGTSLDVDLVATIQHESVVCDVCFSPDGKFIATGCNKSAQIFDSRTGEKLAVLVDNQVDALKEMYIRGVRFSPDGKLLATGDERGMVLVWDLSSRTIRNEFAGHERDIYCVDFGRDGRTVASCSGDRTVRLWDIQINEVVLILTTEDELTCVAISPDSELVAVGSLDKAVRVWQVSTGNLLHCFERPYGHSDSVYGLTFLPYTLSGDYELWSGGLDKTIKSWKLLHPEGTRRDASHGSTLEGHQDFVLGVAVTNDGRWVISSSKDCSIQFWDCLSGIPALMVVGHRNSVINVAASPVGHLVATASGDKRARIWAYKEAHQ